MWYFGDTYRSDKDPNVPTQTIFGLLKHIFHLKILKLEYNVLDRVNIDTQHETQAHEPIHAIANPFIHFTDAAAPSH